MVSVPTWLYNVTCHPHALPVWEGLGPDCDCGLQQWLPTTFWLLLILLNHNGRMAESTRLLQESNLDPFAREATTIITQPNRQTTDNDADSKQTDSRWNKWTFNAGQSGRQTVVDPSRISFWLRVHLVWAEIPYWTFVTCLRRAK